MMDEQKITKIHLPWQWLGTPGSFTDQRPKTRMGYRRYVNVDRLFGDKVDKYIPIEPDNVACFKLDYPSNYYYFLHGYRMGNTNDSLINVDDLFTGTTFDGETFS